MSKGIAAVLAATMLTAVFATAMTLSINYAEGQTLPTSCPVGYHRNEQGTCVPDIITPSDANDTDIVCSGFSYTCG